MAHVTEIDAITGEVIERDFTADEMAQREYDIAAAEAAALAEEQARASKEVARSSAIARFKKLGFTDEEIAELVLPGGA